MITIPTTVSNQIKSQNSMIAHQTSWGKGLFPQKTSRITDINTIIKKANMINTG